MASSFVFLNSNDRIGGGSTDCSFYLSNYDYNRGDTTIMIESCSFFNIQYPVRSGNNNILFYENGVGTPLTFTVTPGDYTPSNLLTAFLALMNSTGANTYTMTYDSIVKKYTIGTTLPDTFAIDATSSILGVLGFTTGYNTYNASKTSDSPINLAGDLFVDIELSGFANNNILSSYVSNSIFHRIALTVNYGELVYFQNCLENNNTLISNEQLQTIRVRMLNPDGSLYQLPDNFYWSMTLKIQSA